MNWKRILPVIFGATTLAMGGSGFVLAQTDAPTQDIQVQDPNVQAEIDALNATIAQKKLDAAALDGQISQYKDRIKQAETQQTSLQNELDILSTQIDSTTAQIQSTQANIDATNAQIAVLNKQSVDLQSKLITERQLIAALLQKINTTDDGFRMQLLFGSTSVGQLLNGMEALRSVDTDLNQALKNAQQAQAQIAYLEDQQKQQAVQLAAFLTSQQQTKAQLEDESNSKQQLIADTQYSESRFDGLIQDLKQQQDQIANEAQQLKDEVNRKLQTRGSENAMAFIWPVDPHYRGLSTIFHDPTYPYNNLFPHTGIDIPQPDASSVHAAAAGYVAWVKKGTDYGNYIMIIHANGLATLYAHLSRPLEAGGQYVNQGDVVALSGGLPGESGAGLSTGAHLHFEVRLDGIPVDPLQYLPKWQ